MKIILANTTYNLTIVVLVFRELVGVLNNYCLHTEKMRFGTKSFIYVRKQEITLMHL